MTSFRPTRWPNRRARSTATIRPGVRLALLAGGVLTFAAALGQDAVSALGRLEPERGILRLTSPVNLDVLAGSVVQELHVKAGDDVTAGQVLAVMDIAPMRIAALAEADADLLLARRQVERARGVAEETCVRARVARREADRRAELLQKGVAGEEEAELAAGEAESSAASCAAAQIAIGTEEARVELARATIQRRQAELERAYLTAPFDGRVLQVLAHPGEAATQGVLELALVQNMLAIAEVFETDIRRVKVGQPATVSSDALEQVLSGRVERIRPKVARQQQLDTDPAARKDARIIEVEIRLDEPAAVANFTNLQVHVVIRP